MWAGAGGTEDSDTAARVQKAYRADWQKRELLGHSIHSLAAAA